MEDIIKSLFFSKFIFQYNKYKIFSTEKKDVCNKHAVGDTNMSI